MSIIAQIALCSLVVSQYPNQRITQNPNAQTLDPYLFKEIVEPVTKAYKAELDPKRGPENAIQILKVARKLVPEGSDRGLGIDLRIAGIALRQSFLGSQKFKKPQRYEQALSTFSRLDLFEPGFVPWLDLTLKNHPEARKKMGSRKKWNMEVAILSRTRSLDRKMVAKRFKKVFGQLGIGFKLVSSKKAEFVFKIGAVDAQAPDPQKRAVKVMAGMEAIEDQKVEWRHTIFRTSQAVDPQVALEASLDWVVRMAARDLLFRWMAENGFETLMVSAVGEGDHHGHHHHGHGPAGGQRRQGLTPVGKRDSTRLKVTVPKKAHTKDEHDEHGH